jgi:hypothetical protein
MKLFVMQFRPLPYYSSRSGRNFFNIILFLDTLNASVKVCDLG